MVVEKNPGEQPHLVLAVIYDGDLASAFQFLVDNGTSLMLFQAVNANIERQFEFIQASWINSTLSSTLLTLAADKDPILGAHDETGTFAMPGSPPIFAWKLPRFVRVRGSAYFLLPSLSALDELVNGYTGPWPFPTRGAPAAPHFRNPDQASPPASP